METGTFILMILAAAVAAALAGGFVRVRLWRRGRSAPVRILYGLAAIPKRYLVDLHNVMMRDRYTAVMHVLVAGGFVASFILLLIFLAGGMPEDIIRGLLLAALTAMAIGAVMARRRRSPRPKRLSGGGFNRLPYSFLAYFIGLFLLTTTTPEADNVIDIKHPVPLLAAILLGWGLLELLVGLTWGGPMKHAFTGALHLAFHPREERFRGAASATALKPLELEQTVPGVEKPRDFTWNQLLGFDACVQCGRCEQACPAFAAGQPLNPKKLIQDLVAGFSNASDRAYRGSGHPGRTPGAAVGAPDRAIVPALVAPETLWSCTTCRACVHECPMMIEHVDAVIDMRRFLTLAKGKVPGTGSQALEEMRINGNPGGMESVARTDWASDLALPLMREVRKANLLLWLGDGAFNRRNQRTLRALVQLLRAADADFATLGDEELDCGDLARRLGDEETFQNLARRNIDILGRYEFQTIITTDPHVLHCLVNEYPVFGGNFDVVHHTTFLARLLAENRLRVAQPENTERKITYHDPCYLGRYSGEFDAPRQLLNATGAALTEMERSGPRSRCCGGGGGAPWTDVKGEQRIPDIRIQDARETEAAVVAVACPNCAVMLEGVVGPRPEVRDVAELLLETVAT